MLAVEPHDGVAVLVLHGRDINTGAVVNVYGRPARAVVSLNLDIPFVAPGLAPGRAMAQLETVGGSDGPSGPAFATVPRRIGKDAAHSSRGPLTMIQHSELGFAASSQGVRTTFANARKRSFRIRYH